MPCFFCSSNDHVSHNCNVHISNADRREILDSKNCCQGCLTQRKFYLINRHNGCIGCMTCQHCERYRKCYICFSNVHHTVFCPDRVTTSETCLPKIDNDLLPRYIGMLSTEEKYSLFLSSSIDPDFVKLTPFKVEFEKETYFSKYLPFLQPKSDILVAEKACMRYEIPHQLYSRNIVFRTKYLDVQSSEFFSDEFLQFLSLSKTKILKCQDAHFHPKLAIVDIFKNAPNLEDVYLRHSNIEISNSWPDDLLQYAANLKKFNLSITDLNFNVESLAALMKKKSITILIFIQIIIKNGRFNEKKSFQKVTNQLSSHFTPTISNFQSSTGLFVHIHDEFGSVVSKQYVLKDD